jgi:transcriptional regulator with XRE-family HTH domain
MMNYKNLADAIKEFRSKAGLTQEELASQIGFTGGYIAQIESGKRFPNHQTLVALCKALGLDKSEEDALVELYEQARRMRHQKRMQQREKALFNEFDQTSSANSAGQTSAASTPSSDQGNGANAPVADDVNVILDGRIVSAAHYHILRDLNQIESDLRALAADVKSDVTTLPSVCLMGLGRCGTNIAVRVSTLAYEAKKAFQAAAKEADKKRSKESLKSEPIKWRNEWVLKRFLDVKEFINSMPTRLLLGPQVDPIYLVEPIVLIADLDSDILGRVKASGFKEILEAGDSKLKPIELSDVHHVGAGNVPLIGQYLAKIILNGGTSTLTKDPKWKHYHSYLIDSAGYNINPSRVFFYIFSAGGGTGSGMSSEFALAQQYSYHHRVHAAPVVLSAAESETETKPSGFEPIFSAGIAILPHFDPGGGEYAQAIHVNAGRLICKYLSEEWRFSKVANADGLGVGLERALRPWNALMLISNNIMSHIEKSDDSQKIDVTKMEEYANQYVAQQIFNILTAQAQTKDYDEQYFMKAGISRKDTIGIDPNDLYMSLTGPVAIAYAESMTPAKDEQDLNIKDVFLRSIGLPSLNKQTHAIEGISILPQPPDKYADTLLHVGEDVSALSGVKFFAKCSATLSIISMPKGTRLANSEFRQLKLMMDRVFPHTRIKRYSLVVGTSAHLSLTTLIARSACLSDEVLTLLFAYIKRCFAKEEHKYSNLVEEVIQNYLMARIQNPIKLKEILKDSEDPSEIMEANWKDVKAMYERKYRALLPAPRSFVAMDSIRLGVEDVINALQYISATFRHKSVPLTPTDITSWEIKE